MQSKIVCPSWLVVNVISRKNEDAHILIKNASGATGFFFFKWKTDYLKLVISSENINS